MKNSAEHIAIYRFWFFRKVSDNSLTIFLTQLTFDNPLLIVPFPFARKAGVFVVTKGRINGTNHLNGNV